MGSGRPYPSDNGMSARELELQREVNELRIANEILKDALGFFAKASKCMKKGRPFISNPF